MRYFSLTQTQTIQLSLLFLTADQGIDSSGIDIRMPQQVSQVTNIPFFFVEGHCKQMAQVMRIYLRFRAASKVMYFTSLTRMPVAQMVCIIM